MIRVYKNAKLHRLNVVVVVEAGCGWGEGPGELHPNQRTGEQSA